MTIHAEMVMLDSQRFPEKLCLIKHELDMNGFNLYNSGLSSIVTCVVLLIENILELSD